MMNMLEVFTGRLNALKAEVRNLKTAHFKTSTALAVASQNSQVSFALKAYGTYAISVMSEKKAIVTLTTADGTNMVSAVYLKGATPSNLNRRRVFVDRLNSSAGQARFAIWVYSQNPDDFTALSGGGQIDVSYAIECVGTSRFNVSIEYVDYDKGY